MREMKMKNYKNYEEFFNAIVEAIKTDKDVYVNEFCIDDNENWQKDENDENYHDFFASDGVDLMKLHNQIMWLMQEEKLERTYIVMIESYFEDDLSITRLYVTRG